MYSKNTIKIFIIIFLLAIITYVCIYHGICKKSLSNSKKSLSNSRYIFIDGGAHKGETIYEFERSNLYSKHRWEIFSFEANPYLISYIPKKKNVTVLNKAMWIDNKGLDFYFGVSTLAGNVVENKQTDTTKKSIKVDSVDFGQWLKENFKQEDIIFVKLDIEGAEYPILDKMLKDESIEYVDKLYVEFHSSIMDDITEAKDKELVDAIKKLGILVAVKLMDSGNGKYFDE
ncbi:MAG: FkbM family methyltransferase [Candidatus Omnitrophica bacterium]|nr:FkbM family methyltransferase [Candidatus Omnitrophota bacterium]